MTDHSRIENFLKNVVSEVSKQEECKHRTPSEIALSIRFEDGHIHHHIPADKEIVENIIHDLCSVSGIDLNKPEIEIEKKKPIIFRNRQAIGDILMMTCSLRDFKCTYPDWPVNVQSTAMRIWDNNPYLDRSLNNSNADVVEIGPSTLTNASNRDDRHFANAYRISMEEKLGIEIKQGPIKPDIWMTEEEIREPIIEPPYWIIVAGEKGDWTTKTYPFKRWQEIVENYPDFKFVQIGAKEHKHPKLEGDNVINMIGKTQDKNTGIRDLFRLFYFAEGSMGLVSFQMHLAAAFEMPCVVIAGAREPARFTRYPGHQYLATDGCLPCSSVSACWHCDLEKTCSSIIEKHGQKFPLCVDIIKTEDVIRAIDQYYEGGRLSKTKPRTPVLPNPLANKKIEIPMVKANLEKKEDLHKFKKEEDFVNPQKYGFNWGGACITDLDWEFLAKEIDRYKIKNVLEFGPGLSTFLMSRKGVHIVCFETSDGWVKDLKEKGIDKIANLHKWNGQIIPTDLPKFDMALVDGPPGGKSREFSVKIASEHADLVFVHDAGREWERKWQDKYLKEKFDGPKKGGHRFHFWVRKDVSLEKKPESRLEIPDNGKETIRFFCNTRGDGGAGRSLDYFMKAFVNLNWNVQYVYSNPQPSGTHRRCGSPKVLATNNLEILRTPCDVFVLATDDYVWEFSKPEVVNMFSSINAKRKVMYVNFRAGKLGEIPWTRGWDKYLFLNDSLRETLVVAYMKGMGYDKMYSISTKVLPPPVEISDFLEIEPDYSGPMRIIRHSSQGNSKYSNDFNNKIEAILETFPDATIRLMPGPSFLEKFDGRVISHERNVPEVKEFLKLGNVFFYDLPENYTEGGPRVLVEAMAAGLPCIATNVSGPKDRIIKETGFLYNDFEEALPMFERLSNPVIREKMGKAAKEHARINFDPNNWIKEIIGEEENNKKEKLFLEKAGGI